MMIRMLIAEDHPVLRAALRALLEAEPDLEVVGEAGDTGATLGLAGEVRPDVILLDIGLPGLQGFDTVRLLTHTLTDTRVLLLMDYEDASLARDALLAGAAGCVVGQTADSTLAAAVRAILQGQLYIQPCVMRALIMYERPQSAVSDAADDLTPREIDVLRLIAQGCTNREVAEELGLSVQTVEIDRERLMVKLGLHSRAQLMRYAAARQLAAGPDRQLHSHNRSPHP